MKVQSGDSFEQIRRTSRALYKFYLLTFTSQLTNVVILTNSMHMVKSVTKHNYDAEIASV